MLNVRTVPNDQGTMFKQIHQRQKTDRHFAWINNAGECYVDEVSDHEWVSFWKIPMRAQVNHLKVCLRHSLYDMAWNLSRPVHCDWWESE